MTNDPLASLKKEAKPAQTSKSYPACGIQHDRNKSCHWVIYTPNGVVAPFTSKAAAERHIELFKLKDCTIDHQFDDRSR
jgi:hypothetical protein